MPTPSEQKALAFFAIVILLAGAVRVVRAGSPRLPSAEEQQALAHQAEAVEGAIDQSGHTKRGHGSRRTSRSRRNGSADTVDGVARVPFSDVRPDRPFGPPSAYMTRDGWVNGFPPPSPRIDISGIQSAAAQSSSSRSGRQRVARRGGKTSMDSSAKIDLDVASVAEIEGLPRVGPALAARLIANRDSFGPFRTLEGLRRVRGMGPATLDRLTSRVTFSGRAASSSARSRYD